MTSTTTTGWREDTLAFLHHHHATRAGDIADRLVATIEREHLAYRRSGLVSHTDLELSCRGNVSAVLTLLTDSLAHGAPGLGDPVYSPARVTGTRRAEQGLPLDDVLRSFRIGGRMIWDDLLVEGADRLDGTGLREVGSLLWEVVDTTSAEMAAAYHDHERARVRNDEQRRATLWEGLLNGGARDPGFALEAASVLDLPPSGELVVVLADGLGPERATRALGPHATAFTRRGDLLVGVVALREASPDAVYDALALLAADHDGRPAAEGPTIAVSSVVDGLARVDEGHRQAAVALRTTRRPSRLVRYEQVLPEALLVAEPGVADRLLDRWVRPLSELGEEGSLLLDTLTAWVAAGGSASRAAPRVPCHRNTVLNRLRRVSQVTGMPLADDAPPLDLDLALRARLLRH